MTNASQPSASQAKPPQAVGAGRPDRYHHGDLRAGLLAAAEAELEDHGIEAFSLRGVAKRAGVSHAAPAHHFRDSNGLLTALAAEGFARLTASMRARWEGEAGDPLAKLVASGLGYIAFATAHPALFRLIFSSTRPDHAQPALCAASQSAFEHLVADIAALHGQDPSEEPMAMASVPMLDVMAAWAVVHGLADLLNAGRMEFLLAQDPPAREAALAEIIRRTMRP